MATKAGEVRGAGGDRFSDHFGKDAPIPGARGSKGNRKRLLLAIVSLLLSVLTGLNIWLLTRRLDPYILPGEVFKEARLEPKEFSVSLENLQTIIFYCDETGVPVWLACRLFSLESSLSGRPEDPNWISTARSYVDAFGYGQILKSNLKEFAIIYNNGIQIDPYDPVVSIRVSLRYLADLHKLTNSWFYALASYNGGLAHFVDPRRFGKFKQESLDYARRILG